MEAMPASEKPAMEGGDWRTQLSSDSRQINVNKIFNALNKFLSEEKDELRKFAVRYEEKIYRAASSQSDYLRRTSLKEEYQDTADSSGKYSNENFAVLFFLVIIKTLGRSQGMQSQVQNLQSVMPSVYGLTQSPVPNFVTPMTQSMMPQLPQQPPRPLQQPRIIGQQTNATNIHANMQQSRLIQPQQQLFMAPQNNLSNLLQGPQE
ncbi:hypothetical protein PTKIN_Ptkin13bG0140700 [Pterospermum kingtungense]